MPTHMLKNFHGKNKEAEIFRMDKERRVAERESEFEVEERKWMA